MIMCSHVWIYGVCAVWLVGRTAGDCVLPQHPGNGRHQPQGDVCGGSDKPPACDGTPGTPAPEDWLLTVVCNPGYQPPDPDAADIRSVCTNGSWSIPQLTDCVISECGVSKEVNRDSPTLLNATDAHVGFFPWHAGLYYSQETDGKTHWNQQCGGSLITDQVILTAAHCVAHIANNVNGLRIALGKYFRSWDANEPTEQKREVLAITISPQYSTATFTSDIALVLMSEKIKFSEYIMPVCRDYEESTAELLNTNSYVVGWGKTDVDAPSSEKLHYNTVRTIPDNQCRKSVPVFYATFEKLCGVKNNSESVTQRGDGGGGLTTVYKDGRHYIVGIVSTKIERISLFTNVKWKKHIDWIDFEIKQFKTKYNS